MDFLRLAFVFIILCSSQVNAYDGAVCCDLAKSQGAFIGDVPEVGRQVCGQSYAPGLDPASVLSVAFQWCWDNCGSMDLSLWKEVDSWLAPVVQFILPSVIFAMAIPRQKRFDLTHLFDFPRLPTLFHLVVSVLLFWLILLPTVLDTVIWISTIVVTAASMVVSGLYEAIIDYRIISYVQSLDNTNDQESLTLKQELLITVASGNLQLDNGDPKGKILKAITIPSGDDNGFDKSRSRLLNLLGAQSSFGGAVGSAVLFYLGAFGYTLRELHNDPSDQDAAISLGFGIEWMIIVHVAIMSGCLLASNNPSTSSGIVGTAHAGLKPRRNLYRMPTLRGFNEWVQSTWTLQRFRRTLGWTDVYDTEFQPVALRHRGTNKMRWAKKSKAYEIEPFQQIMFMKWWEWIIKIWIPCLILIVVPPAAGGIVAFLTPPRGVGRRSASFIVYAVSQTILVSASTIHTALNNKNSSPITSQHHASRGSWYAWVSGISIFFALLSAVGGVIMQLTGVYKNCVCYAGAQYWFGDIFRLNPPINLASDTSSAREASHYWKIAGGAATIFMAANCYLGWWYQRLVRQRFQRTVEAMQLPNTTSSDTTPNDPANTLSSQTNDTRATSSDSSRPLLNPIDLGRRFTGGFTGGGEAYEMRDRPQATSSRIEEERDLGEIAHEELGTRDRFARVEGATFVSGSRQGSLRNMMEGLTRRPTAPSEQL